MRPRYRHGDGALSGQAQGSWPAIRSCRSGSISPRTWWRTHGSRLPDLTAVVGDAAGAGRLLPGPAVRLHLHAFRHGICADARARPKIAGRLKPGGYWSFVGGTKAAYPALQAKGDSQAPCAGSAGRDREKWTTRCSIRRTCRRSPTPWSAHGFEMSRRRNLRAGARIQRLRPVHGRSAIAADGSRRLSSRWDCTGPARSSAGCSTGSPFRSRIRTTS